MNGVNRARVRELASLRRDWYKRPLDLLVLFLAHLVLFPLFLILWTVIPLVILMGDGRPIFYRVRKVGKDGKLFDALKFRTMVRDADKTGPALTAENDQRLTRFGRVLRKTALDELPELINILKGQTSFVGPRAYSVSGQQFGEQEVPGFSQRLQVRPGLTGYAQVYGKRRDLADHFSCDLYYIEHRSLWLDLKLLFLSVWVALKLGWDRKVK